MPRAEPSVLVRWNRGQVVVNAIGPLKRARRKVFESPSLCIRIVLRAGRARALLGTPMHELADRIVPIEDLWRDAGAQLRESLAATDLPRAIELVESALRDRLAGSDVETSRDEFLADAMRALDVGDDRIATVARDLGLSDRHLRRLFQEHLGMTPKHYARIARLGRVLSRRPSPWAAVAAEAGFHDQSHLIREFRDLLQVTPQSFRNPMS